MQTIDEPRQDEAMERATAAARKAEQHTRELEGAFRREHADNLIKRHMLAAGAIGLVPLPLVNVAALVAAQLAMARALSSYYGVPFDEIRARAAVVSLLASSAPVLSVVTLSSFLGLIPGIGTLVGSGGVAVVGGATTYAVGEVLVHHFERGGTLLDIDVKALKGRFQREMKRGRDVAVSLVRK